MISYRAILLLLLISPALSFSQTRVLTVCEVLSNIDKYRGQVVAVKGIVIGTFYHGHGLRDYEVKGECPEVVQKGEHWPPGFRLGFPSKNREPTEKPLQFVPDFKSIDEFLNKEKAIEDEAFAKNKFNIGHIGIFIGEVQAREKITIWKDSTNAYTGNGYGLGGRYPVFFLLKSIVDLKRIDLDNWNWVKEDRPQ